MTTRILIVEDDPDLALCLADNLEGLGYSVETAGNGRTALERVHATAFELVLLDIMLPKLDGLSVCRQIRDHYPRLPIIMMSARGTEEEKVVGLETGADDYIAKPFGVQEILARVRALLRRSHPGALDVTCAQVGDATIDFLKQELRRGEECMKIGSYECRILQYMLARRGQVVTREELLRDVWGLSGPRPGDRTVDNYVAKLRRKVEKDPRRPRHIITIHGSGYRFLP